MSASKWKPYPEYKSSGSKFIGEIPIRWNTKPLKGIIDQRRPITYGIVQCGPKLDSGVPYIRPADMTDEGGVKMDNIQYTSEEIAAPFARSIIKGGDLVVSIGPSYGKVMTVPVELEGGNLTQGTARIAVSDSNFPDYFFWVMRSKNILNQWDSLVQGATFRALNLEPLANSVIPLPPKSDQQKISFFIRKRTEIIDEIISKLNFEKEALEEKRSVLITQAITKGLDPEVQMKDTGLDWYPKIPSHWKLHRVKNVAKISPSNVDKKKYAGQDEVSLANYVDVYYNDRITEELDLMVATASDNEIAKFSLIAGDIIITKDSETWDDIAVPAFVPVTMERVVCGYHLSLIRPNKVHVLGEFLFRTYQALGVRDQYHYNANGVTRYGLGSYWVDNGVIPVPPIHEQHAITEYIDKKLRMIEMTREYTENAIEKLEEYRTVLISAAVTGKIDVRGQA